MRELLQNEINTVAGGSMQDNNGYNFNYVLGEAMSIGVLGYIICGLNFSTGAILGASYGALRMAATMLDYRYFPKEPEFVSTVEFVQV